MYGKSPGPEADSNQVSHWKEAVAWKERCLAVSSSG